MEGDGHNKHHCPRDSYEDVTCKGFNCMKMDESNCFMLPNNGYVR